MKALNKQVSKMSEAELIRAIAEASELRPRDGRNVVALRVYEQVLKPLLDEQSELETRVANESDCADNTINLAINWQMRCKDAEAKLESAEKRIAELNESHRKLRDTMATIHNTIRMDGGYTPLAAILNAAKRAHEESTTAAGIGVKGE